MKKLNLFIALLGLDLGTKALAFLIEPNNSFFNLVYNKNMVFGLELSNWMKFGAPLLILPWFFVMASFITNKEYKSNYLQIVMAAVLGNYICRFFDCGVVDFIVVGNVTANLADIYGWLSYAYFIKIVVIPKINTFMNQQRLTK